MSGLGEDSVGDRQFSLGAWTSCKPDRSLGCVSTIAEIFAHLISGMLRASALAVLAIASACTDQSPDEPMLADLEATKVGMIKRQVERRIGRPVRILLVYDAGGYTFGFSDGRLNSRMQVLEKGAATDWRGIEPGMTISQVETIMGKPSRECLRYFVNKGGKTTAVLQEWELCFKGGLVVDINQVYIPHIH
jgi:hypothetical protein